MNDSLAEIYTWVQGQLDQPILLGYRLYKVNGQVADSILLLIRQAGGRRPEAEIQIDYRVHQATGVYQTSVTLLPFAQGRTLMTRSESLGHHFVSQQAVLY